VDETILDNSEYERRIVASGEKVNDAEWGSVGPGAQSDAVTRSGAVLECGAR
jgi:predicted secreted acid phosphatase